MSESSKSVYDKVMKPILEQVQDPAKVAEAAFHVSHQIEVARGTTFRNVRYAPDMGRQHTRPRDFGGENHVSRERMEDKKALAARFGVSGGRINTPAVPGDIHEAATALVEYLKTIGLPENVTTEVYNVFVDAVPASMPLMTSRGQSIHGGSHHGGYG